MLWSDQGVEMGKIWAGQQEHKTSQPLFEQGALFAWRIMPPLTSAQSAANSTRLLLYSATPGCAVPYTNLSRTDKTAASDLPVKPAF